MRTAHALTISWGVYLVLGGVLSPGGVSPGGCLPRGEGVCPGGVCLGGVPTQVLPPVNWSGTPPCELVRYSPRPPSCELVRYSPPPL